MDHKSLDTYQMFRVDPGTCAVGSGDKVPDYPPEMNWKMIRR